MDRGEFEVSAVSLKQCRSFCEKPHNMVCTTTCESKTDFQEVQDITSICSMLWRYTRRGALRRDFNGTCVGPLINFKRLKMSLRAEVAIAVNHMASTVTSRLFVLPNVKPKLLSFAHISAKQILGSPCLISASKKPNQGRALGVG